ncbi:MAG: MFS transporter, partial [Myxococcota bacterium]|nr:MFS transporter [Myxococcota bacterium]
MSHLVSPPSSDAAGARSHAPKPELIAIIASLMALNALAIDIMLPALRQIATDFTVADPNDQQLVILAYVLGFGAPQLVWGPLADRFGR